MKAATFFLILLVFITAGCATQPPAPPVDAQKLAQVKRITIATPAKSKYLASVGAAPVVGFADGGVGANAVSGLVSGLLTAITQSKAEGFDNLVKSTLPGLDINREFVDRVKSELTAQGYAVTEVELGKDGAPVVTGDPKTRTFSMTAGRYADADAILWMPILTAYWAPGPLNSYARNVSADVHLFSVHTNDEIAHRTYRYVRVFGDEFSYATYNGLTENLERAIGGLREALLAFVPEIATMLKKAAQ